MAEHQLPAAAGHLLLTTDPPNISLPAAARHNTAVVPLGLQMNQIHLSLSLVVSLSLAAPPSSPLALHRRVAGERRRLFSLSLSSLLPLSSLSLSYATAAAVIRFHADCRLHSPSLPFSFSQRRLHSPFPSPLSLSVGIAAATLPPASSSFLSHSFSELSPSSVTPPFLAALLCSASSLRHAVHPASLPLVSRLRCLAAAVAGKDRIFEVAAHFLVASRRLAATAPPPSALPPSSPIVGAVAGFQDSCYAAIKNKIFSKSINNNADSIKGVCMYRCFILFEKLVFH